MTFDWAAYVDTVLQPLARDEARLQVLAQMIREVQGAGALGEAARLDVGTLFAIEPSMDSGALAAHCKSLTSLFNKRTNLPSAQLLKKLLAQFAAAADITDPLFWESIASQRVQASAEATWSVDS